MPKLTNDIDNKEKSKIAIREPLSISASDIYNLLKTSLPNLNAEVFAPNIENKPVNTGTRISIKEKIKRGLSSFEFSFSLLKGFKFHLETTPVETKTEVTIEEKNKINTKK